ncbi:MAG: glycine--tRNA ligase subunit beta, partial [Hyphomicrobium sp.]|uniref:glycine--tRNA ligase subunit beta n=1 Tax=Hyphomicrobium sp. TaxID=82 RepID=UPI003D099CB3
MAELLIELFSEEIPARMQGRAAEDLLRLVTGKLKAAGLAHNSAQAFATPRRLALMVDGLPTEQPEIIEEKKGPRVGSPEKAIEGFLKSAGLARLDQCEERDTGKGMFWFAVVKTPGGATAAKLPALIGEAIAALPWPKSMRFADQPFRWVRPLHRVLAMFDGARLEGALDLGAGRVLPFADKASGHRFLRPDEFGVACFADYKRRLAESYVLLDPDERRAAIRERAEAAAKAAGLALRRDDALLEEVTGLVEWPVVLTGRIDDAFMALPPEVLTTTMRTHQKYFALLDDAGRLAPRFLLVSNMETKDKGAAIVAGNERVLRARLADAKFFWDQDRKATLESRVPALKDIVFHAKLGTLAEKMARVEALAVEIAKHVPGADEAKTRRAARLAKADLTSGMVGEFPELQGIMGRYYALAEGEAPEVAVAIAEHYAPQGPNDSCPTAPVSVALALADKLDILAGFFAIDEKPTGSKDPFALRRAALGAIRLIVENKLRLNLSKILDRARQPILSNLPNQIGPTGVGEAYKQLPGWPEPLEVKVIELLDFFADRMKVALKEQGVRHDLIAAVFALGGEDDLVRLLARVDALATFLAGEDGANLLTAQKRAANILRIEEKKDGKSYAAAPDAALLTQPEEKALHVALIKAAAAARDAVRHEDFTAAMAAMSELRKPVDAFFDKVTVNDADPALRGNRLKLL